MNIEDLAHNTLLPRALVDRVPQREKLILAFVLAFLEAQRRERRRARPLIDHRPGR